MPRVLIAFTALVAGAAVLLAQGVTGAGESGAILSVGLLVTAIAVCCVKWITSSLSTETARAALTKPGGRDSRRFDGRGNRPAGARGRRAGVNVRAKCSPRVMGGL